MNGVAMASIPGSPDALPTLGSPASSCALASLTELQRQLAETKKLMEAVSIERDAAVRTSQELLQARDKAVEKAEDSLQHRDDAIRKSAEATQARDVARTERDEALQQRDAAMTERDLVRDARNEAAQQVRRMKQELDAAANEIDGLKAKLSIQKGPSWSTLLEVVKLTTIVKIRELGAGGFGRVFLTANPVTPGSTCKELLALKLISVKADESRDHWLSRELTTLGKLRHPNIVSIRAAVVDDNDPEQHAVGYLMDYIDGGTLETAIINRGGANVAELVAIAVACLSALSYLHAHSVYHRDLKPANIMISSSGNVSLCDFGTATRGDFGRAMASATAAGAPTTNVNVPGSPKYMCPSCNREGPGDIYALGLTLIEVAAGRTMMNPLAAAEFLRENPASLVPARVTEMLQNMFRSDPTRRPTAPEALAQFQDMQSEWMPYSSRNAPWVEALAWIPLGSRSLSASCPDKFRSLLLARHPALASMEAGHLFVRNTALETAFESRTASLYSRSVGNIVKGVPCSGWEADNKDDNTNVDLPPAVINHRRAVMQRLEECLNQWTVNQSSPVKLLLVFHATTRAAARKIAECGFVSFATLDNGYFGKGLYFTPDVDYARDVYAKFYSNKWDKIAGSDTSPVILAVFVRVRHVFPVIDMSYLGKPNRGGYDAHVTVVQRSLTEFDYKPVDPTSSSGQKSFLELIVFESAQALPVCIMPL